MASSTGMTRREFFAGAAAGTGAAVAGSTFPRPAIAQLMKVRYTLSWLPTGQYAYIYSARQLGYFKQRGIDLDISRGYGSMAAIQAVSTGQFEMGGAQTGATLLSMMKGLEYGSSARKAMMPHWASSLPRKDRSKARRIWKARRSAFPPRAATRLSCRPIAAWSALTLARSLSSSSTARSWSKPPCPASSTPSS